MTSFLPAKVMHARLRPKLNKFRYRAPYVLVNDAELTSELRAGVFSINRHNIFSVLLSDYGDGTRPALEWVRSILDRWHVTNADGSIVLVTMPRICNVGFNPVSFWLCLDKQRRLRAVVSEVNNTFGERHFYLCVNEDHRPIAPTDSLTVEKVFHVSPFLAAQGRYRFAFSWDGAAFAVRIDLEDANGKLLVTSLSGRREPLSSRRLLAALLSNPLLMVKVLGLIHYQALRLFLKGVPHVRKPPPPAELVSRSITHV